MTKKPRGTRITDVATINARIAAELRGLRIAAGVTLVQVAEIFDEQKPSISKIEHGIRQPSLARYLGMVRFLGVPPGHPAVGLIQAVGVGNLEAMRAPGVPQVRLIEYLQAIELTRDACPNHPALPLCDYFLCG